MGNYFLKVDKDLFQQGLNPLEILLVSQIAEFENNTGDCFISDKTLAENFGVSESTISRTIKALETKGFIERETRNTQKGKERHLRIKERANSKMTVAENSANVKMTVAQQSKCLLRTQQNDLIKDNIKDNNIIDKDCFSLPNGSEKGVALAKAKTNATINQKEEPIKVSKQWLIDNGIEYELIIGNLGEIKATGVKVKVID